MQEIKKFWDEGVSFEEYLVAAKHDYENMSDGEDMEMKEYYRLGIQRMERMVSRYHPDAGQKSLLSQMDFKGKILIISEPWCGDASQALPVISAFFGTEHVRITYRDKEPSLIDDFLTNGAKSIPVVIILNETFEVLNVWGARPQYGKELLEIYKQNPETYSKEQCHNDLQVYYAKNKGYDTIKEILEMISLW